MATGLHLRVLLLVGLIAALAALPAPSRAQSAATIEHDWGTADKCKKESFLKFPDQTEEGAEKRRVYIKQCVAKNIGPRAPAVQN